MKRLTSAQLFDAPKWARKTKVRLARAKLQIVAARERAAVTAQRYRAHALARPMRLATVLQRGRLAERLNASPDVTSSVGAAPVWTFGLFPTASPPAEKAAVGQDQAG